MESSLMTYAALCGATLMIGWLVHWVYTWANPPCKGKLPPGSMGFPLIGETFQFFRTSRSLDIPSYYQERLKRNGPIFKTSLLGKPVVISMDPDLDRFILKQEGKLFRFWFPESGINIFGDKSVVGYTGNAHKFIRSLASKFFGPENLTEMLIRDLEDSIRNNFTAWAAMPSIEVQDGIADMLFNVAAKKMISMDPAEARELRKNFDKFSQGVLCLPLYFPGTLFYNCMKASRDVRKKLTELLKDRLSTSGKKYGDILDLFVDELRSEKPQIHENFVIDALAGLLFASYMTTAVNLNIGLKLLTDNPIVVETLKEEHETILKKREDMNSGFTWEEYRSLKFTTQVINEMNRMSNIIPGIFRKTLKDVQVNGYTIPAGWLVMISPMAIHLNPTLFDDPLKFNPWRWMDQDRTKIVTQNRNFMPFGGGIRLCAGADYSKLVISLFLHVLVTKYRWIEIKGGEVVRFAEMAIPQDYHIKLVPRIK